MPDLRGAVFNVGRRGRPRTVSTAEEAPTHFDAVPDDLALAVLADRRNRLNRAFKAVKRVPDSSRDQLESFVVFVAANFAFCHWTPRD